MPSHQITDDDLILVTGASGYIATHIVKQLLEKGYRVRGTVRSLKDEKKVAPLRNLTDKVRFPIELVEADLLNEASWPKAVKGCTYVLHTASPFPSGRPDNEDVVVKPALNGTLNVLRACAQEGSTVKRVVLTSSVAAIAGEIYKHGYTYTEKDWPEGELEPYLKSKTVAEKAAWDFVKERENKGLWCFELAVVNPGYVMVFCYGFFSSINHNKRKIRILIRGFFKYFIGFFLKGPLLHNSDCTSMVVIQRFMKNEFPMVPDVGLATCDVRDVARAHLAAMVLPEAKNHRHIVASSKQSVSFLDIGQILHEEFTPKNYKIVTTKAPNCVVKVGAIFDKGLRMVIFKLNSHEYFVFFMKIR
jgi:nucleoside-diphosphate-sugar epimerase